MILRKPFIALASAAIVAMASAVVTSCDDDDDVDKYKAWDTLNKAWVAEQAARTDADGNLIFKAVHPNYSPSSTVYMRFCEDPAANAENLRPLFTSYCTVNYTVRLYDGTLVDSAANYTSQLNSAMLIDGWSIAIQQMHVGDTIEAILPANVAYGATGSAAVQPYSALRFNIRLTDIPYYEVRP
ncbi:MAG: FKBP-type peptidyl-prolyl cis-trans isomerase [Muribaculaceae bacterium]|nr:FKBP-type peptidyl-prolyl cis-trans isomerase [Muribaculaceae bacterium]